MLQSAVWADAVNMRTNQPERETLFGETVSARQVERDTRTRRVYALAGLLQTVRAQHGWSVETAAVHAGIGHMTWRRAEQGVPGRIKTYAALDRLFDLPPGTVNRATRNDEMLVELAQHLGVDTTRAKNVTATDWVEKFAEQSAARLPAGRVATRAQSTEDTPTITRGSGVTAAIRLGATGGGEVIDEATRRALTTLALHVPKAAPTDLELATQLVERMTHRAPTEAINSAVDAILRAMPDLIARQLHDAEEELAADDRADAAGREPAYACASGQ